jgi:hypothetical protein
MLIQIHMLQNYAPSNLNRDQSGAVASVVNVKKGPFATHLSSATLSAKMACWALAPNSCPH